MLNDFWQVIRHPLRWLRCKPPAGATFRVSLREAVQGLCGVTCEFKPITEAGEEEHGPHPFKRKCTKCGKRQFAEYHRTGDIRLSWHDESERQIDLP